ncbi:MAG: 4Fe-4S binding protein [Proteobacteria bacterium]|nr:4Fe-4S binding protein [Pseudomonadota bacterium]
MPTKGPRGKVHTVVERCKGCGFCIEFCPLKALRVSGTMNRGGFHFPEIVTPDKCSGCNMCGMVCPDFAIWSEKLISEKDEPES